MQTESQFYQVLISAELRTQGLRLLDRLLRKHLIFGGPVLNGPAPVSSGKNEIVEHDYCWIITFHAGRPKGRTHPGGGDAIGPKRSA